MFSDPAAIRLSGAWLFWHQPVTPLAPGRSANPGARHRPGRCPVCLPMDGSASHHLPAREPRRLGDGVATWRRGRWVHLLPVVSTALLFGVLGFAWFKYMRYFLPVYPTLCLLAGWLLVS